MTDNKQLLLRFSPHIICFAWIQWLTLQIGMEWNHISSARAICPYDDYQYPTWYWYSLFLMLGGFLILQLVLIIKILMSRPGIERQTYFPTLNVIVLATLSLLLAVTSNWGGLCVDSIGVASPASIWGEWISTGPLMLFITLSVVDKPALTYEDIFIIVTFWLCLIFGFVLIFDQPSWLAAIWLSLSCVFYLPMFWLVVIARRPSSVSPDALGLLSGKLAKRTNLVNVLICILPWFTVVYIIAMFNVISYPMTIVSFQVLSLLTKGLFVTFDTDMHLELLNTTTRALIEEKRANEARRAHLKYVFHEVRTPLNSLTMGIEVFEQSKNLDRRQIETLKMMKDATMFMSETLNNVLSMQKVEEGMLTLELVPFRIRSSISKTLSSFRGAAQARRIELHDVYHNVNVNNVLKGDKYRVEHILSNLLSNAIKFSPPNSFVKVEVSSVLLTSETGSSMEKITVAVIDQGPGVDPKDQDKLFQNFMQINPGQQQKGQGSGVGLYLCKKLVTLHGGEIGYRIEEGKGSSFFFSITFKLVHEEPLDDSAMRAAEETKRCGDGSPGRDVSRPRTLFADERSADRESYVCVSCRMPCKAAVSSSTMAVDLIQEYTTDLQALVVDDAESNRKMLGMLLDKEGVQCETASDGDEAVEMVRRDRDAFDVVFMDNSMERMNGDSAARAMRAAGYKHLIVGVTGNVMDDDVRAFLVSGADLVLPKPLRMADLRRLLTFLREKGTKSNLGQTLSVVNGCLQWVDKVDEDGNGEKKAA